jgi:hypothetical protein
VATSDSHANFADPDHPGSDFWPGQFHKTYVLAHPNYDDVLDGLRNGRMFAVAGDLVSELDFTASSGSHAAAAGGTLPVRTRSDVRVTVRFRDPRTANAGGHHPEVRRVDLIAGAVGGPATDRNADRNESARVIKRFTGADWRSDGDVHTLTFVLSNVQSSAYLRLRGTGTGDSEPAMDERGENPWKDLWFYSNPIFLEVSAP